MVSRDGAVLRRPAEDVVAGVALDPGTANPGEVSVYAALFVQPLYVPRDHLDLSHGRRVGRSWTASADAVEAEGLRDLETALGRDGLREVHEIVTPADVSRWLRSREGFEENAAAMEAAAFSDVLVGEIDDARHSTRSTGSSPRTRGTLPPG
jgi:hypothetical protein